LSFANHAVIRNVIDALTVAHPSSASHFNDNLAGDADRPVKALEVSVIVRRA
jgi:hypothetical protein